MVTIIPLDGDDDSINDEKSTKNEDDLSNQVEDISNLKNRDQIVKILL